MVFVLWLTLCCGNFIGFLIVCMILICLHMLQIGILSIQPITLVLLEIFTSNLLGRVRSVPSYRCASLVFINCRVREIFRLFTFGRWKKFEFNILLTFLINIFACWFLIFSGLFE